MRSKSMFLGVLLTFASFAGTAHASLQLALFSPETGLTLSQFTRSPMASVTPSGGVMVTASDIKACLIPKVIFTNTGMSPQVLAQELNNLAAAQENYRLECYIGKKGVAKYIVITDQNGLNGTLFK